MCVHVRVRAFGMSDWPVYLSLLLLQAYLSCSPDISNKFRHLHKSSQMELAGLLQHAIWTWIEGQGGKVPLRRFSLGHCELFCERFNASTSESST
jgi:hypothetical protein